MDNKLFEAKLITLYKRMQAMFIFYSYIYTYVYIFYSLLIIIMNSVSNRFEGRTASAADASVLTKFNWLKFNKKVLLFLKHTETKNIRKFQ